MAFTPDELRGRLFDNREDRKNKRQPDYTGTVTVKGRVYRISGWYNPPNERSKVATIGLQLEDQDDYKRRRDAEASAPGQARTEAPHRADPQARPRAAPQTDDDPEDGIPF